jgi:hypothetical protein
VGSVEAQGTFQNLNFEDADPMPIIGSPYYPYAVIPASALPGWTCEIGGIPATQAFYNTYALGSASIDLLGPGWPYTGPGVIDGNYTVYLQAGSSLTGSGAYNTSISQTGTIPANSESLQFEAWSFYPTAYFAVSFAGNSLTPVVLSSGIAPCGQSYDVYGANIAPYVGQTGLLEFTALDYNPPGNIELDDIAFSTTTITPEPSTLALLLMSGVAFGVLRWRARSPSHPAHSGAAE